MNIVGNITCAHCALETRFLLEDEGSKEVALLGDALDETMKGTTACDYCQMENEVHVVVVESVISAFLTREVYEMMREEKKEIKKAEKNAGLLLEKQKQLQQFNETFTSPYEQHPKQEKETLVIDGNKWIIRRVYKKENIEKDPVIRLFTQPCDEYWYNVTKGEEEKWVVIQQGEENNGTLTQNMPVLKSEEALCEMTEKPTKTTLLIEQPIGEHYEMRAYQMIAGVRIIVELIEEEGREVEFDCFGDTFEEALSQIEEVFAINQ